MPIFEYQCNKCGQIGEMLVMHSTENYDSLYCPHCQNGKMYKVMSAHSFIERSKLRIPTNDSKLRKKQ